MKYGLENKLHKTYIHCYTHQYKYKEIWIRKQVTQNIYTLLHTSIQIREIWIRKQVTQNIYTLLHTSIQIHEI